MDKLKTELISFIDTRSQEQIQFVVDLANQNSYTYHKEGTDRVAEMIFDRLDNILPVHEVVEQDDVGHHHLLRNSSSPKAIYLLGHMDTVFPPDHIFQTCQLKGDMLNGPGTGDMKGGLAVIVYALLALKAVDLLDKLDLVFILNADEEIGSVTSRSIYLEERRRAIACLVAECAGPRGEVVVSRNGKMGVRIDCFGQDRHVGLGPHRKASAILELAEKVVAVESLNDCLSGVTINVGKIEGGLGPCTVPAHASCLVDIRWTEQGHQDIVLNHIQDIVSQTVQHGCSTEMEVLNTRPAMPLTETSEQLFTEIQRIGRNMGQDVIKEHRCGTSDANFFGSIGVPAVDGFGPICFQDHTANESIKLSSLKERTHLLALFLLACAKNEILV